MKLAAKKWQETHFLSDEETEKWIEDYVERETTVAWKRVEDADAAIRRMQEDTGTTENSELITRVPEKMFEEMMVAIPESLTDLASSDDGEDWEDLYDGEMEQGKLSEDDKPGWVMCTIAKMEQQRMETFRKK